MPANLPGLLVPLVEPPKWIDRVVYLSVCLMRGQLLISPEVLYITVIKTDKNLLNQLTPSHKHTHTPTGTLIKMSTQQTHPNTNTKKRKKKKHLQIDTDSHWHTLTFSTNT